MKTSDPTAVQLDWIRTHNLEMYLLLNNYDSTKMSNDDFFQSHDYQ
jgi:hypothetical protein